MLGMKNYFDISGSIEIREGDIAGVACNWYGLLSLRNFSSSCFENAICICTLNINLSFVLKTMRDKDSEQCIHYLSGRRCKTHHFLFSFVAIVCV